MNETFFSQNENELTSEYHIPEKEVGPPTANDAQALHNVASKGENEENENRGENHGENRGDENDDEENYDILNMLNEIKKDFLSENEKLQQQSSQNVHIAEEVDGDKTEENQNKLLKEESQVEEKPLEKQLNSSNAQVSSPGAAPNEQSQENVSTKKGTGTSYKKTKNIPGDAKRSTSFLSKETPKKRKIKSGPNPEYAGLAMYPFNPIHPAHAANLATVSKTNDPLIDDEIAYLTNYEFVTQNYLKGIAKKNPTVKSDNINIDILYSSRSEKSMDESEREAEAEADSSIDSIKELYENICQSDAPLDFYKNSLSAKKEVKDVQPQYFLNTQNSVTDEIQILNRYIKDMTEGQQKNSSSIDVDSKLVNILSLSFLTFIDHVIYDSHIYALKSEFTQGGEADQAKKSTSHGVPTTNGNSEKECLNEEALRERTEKINIVGRSSPNSANIQNDPGKDNTQMCPQQEKSFNVNNSQDDQSKDPPSTVDLLDNPDQAARKEATQNGGVNAPQCSDTVGTQIIYTPDVINLCLHNLYNQELVTKIMNQKMKEGDTSGARAHNLKESDPNTSKFIHTHSTPATAQPGKSEKTNLKEHVNQMDSKSGVHLKSKNSLQTNINHKLNKRQIIINKINEKIKKKSAHSLHSSVNTKKYSLDDLFEL
ncbi:hypothetical protein AK88_02735 [Plasmodium fragile]|uniref:Uncharacterized protein n=1 Tax=Plasmodium fragile TaxID=5857 RepID=A0A0D9QLA8_PLAFR|nr:uncharacterized protein AK88_02735 [Plasmodium fragile]KJP87567.1 hypothetical protein AK88_02735 [Plasmodium fragile]